MRDRHRFDAFYTFERASEADFERWRSSLLWFLKKVCMVVEVAAAEVSCCWIAPLADLLVAYVFPCITAQSQPSWTVVAGVIATSVDCCPSCRCVTGHAVLGWLQAPAD
jgi:hypothetical protein